ncbi:hypothetical protein [Desulfosporosinus hippei]|uniref:Type IV pilus assembly protein PilO n=1 Tax=Desulfosporosinus hippei DSM 8344 TaxID=1121419 RepID=A0A1G8GCW7_9FIRM|nr:hypothetical protein [Desulfosporosinus hippei]SDH92170.1 type IV pilus assembly protein PilO [Desulfosporosinus hippei DSM 8344]
MKLKIDLSKLRNLGLTFKSQKSKKMPRLLQKVKNKRPKSSSLSLSKKDFILLSVLILGLEGYGLYNLVLDPKWQEFSKLKTSYAAKELIAANFEKDLAQKDQYQENLKLLDYKYSTLTKVIPHEIPQEEIVLILNKLAKDRELDINGIALSTISYVSKKDYEAGKVTSDHQDGGKAVTTTSVTSDAKNGEGTSPTSAEANKTTAKPQLANDMVIVEEVDIAFSGSYGALYNFLSDLEKSERKIIVKEVSMTRGTGDLLKGQLKVQYVGYVTTDDKSTYSLETPPVNGKISPFQAYLGFEDNVPALTDVSSAQGPAPVKTYNPNFYLLLNTNDDSAPKIIMGDYTKNGTELYSDSNSSVRGKLSISGNQDNMTYSYTLGGSTQTKNAKLVIDSGKIRFDVISKARKSEQDKVSLTLDVDNKTDYPLEINVINDDKQVPRFSLGSKLGSVTIK